MKLRIIVLILAALVLTACGDEDQNWRDENRRDAQGIYEVILDGQPMRRIENAYCKTVAPGFGSELYVKCFSKVIDTGHRLSADYDSQFLIGRLEVMDIIKEEKVRGS